MYISVSGGPHQGVSLFLACDTTQLPMVGPSNSTVFSIGTPTTAKSKWVQERANKFLFLRTFLANKILFARIFPTNYFLLPRNLPENLFSLLDLPGLSYETVNSILIHKNTQALYIFTKNAKNEFVIQFVLTLSVPGWDIYREGWKNLPTKD